MKRRWGAYLALLLAALLVMGALGSLADELKFEQTGDESSTVDLGSAVDGAVLDLGGGSEPEEDTAYADFVGDAGPVANEGFSGTISEDTLVEYTGTDAEVAVPDTIKHIGARAFCGNQTVVSVTLPASVETIDAYAFEGCSSLKAVKLNEGLKKIGEDAFANCQKLESVGFPSTLTTIGGYAFQNCNGLTSVAIPANVETIGYSAFYGCAGLTSVAVNGPAKPRIAGEIDDNADDGYSGCIFMNCDKLEKAEINGAYVSGSMFEDCAKLADVTLGNGVTSIESCAFYNCDALKAVTVPASVKDIGESAFYSCDALEKVTLNSGLESIGNGAFRECVALTAIAIPGSVGGIGSHAFRDCRKLAAAKLEDGVSVIGSYAFANDEFLAEIAIPESMGNVGKAAFYNCARLAVVTVRSQNMKINKNVFKNIAANPKFSAYCTSTTAKWCAENGIKLSETFHLEVAIEAVPATCSATGLTEGKRCVLCGTITKEQEVVKKLKHTVVVDKAVAATCTKPGKTKGSHCSVCNEVITKQEVVPAKGHKAKKDRAVKPTYTSTGLTEGSHCRRCGEVLVKQEVVPKLEPTKVTLNRQKLNLKVSKTFQLKATLAPRHKTSKSVKLYWYSDNVKVATVSDKGLVKAVGEGTANIVVLTPNGLQASCKVVVTKAGPSLS